MRSFSKKYVGVWVIFLLFGCVPVEAGIYIAGRIVDTRGTPLSNCEGKIFEIRRGFISERKEFLTTVYWSGEFFDSLQVTPGTMTFFVLLKCPDFSSELQLSFDAPKNPGEIIRLGEIVFK